MALAFEMIQFNFNHVNCRLHAKGDKYANFLTFTFILHGKGEPIISNNCSVNHDYVWGFDPNREANLVLPENSLHCAVHIRQDVLEVCAQAMDRPDLNATFWGANYVYIPETLPPLKAYLNQPYALLNQKSPLLCNPDFQQVIPFLYEAA